MVIAAVLAIAIPYRLTLFQGLFLCLGAELFILISCFSGVLGQQRHYVWSSALLRLGNGLLIFPAALMLADPSLRRLDFILGSLLVFLGGVTLLGAILLGRWLVRGQVPITLRQRVSGLIFLASLLALVVPQRGLVVVAGAMLNPVTVAALAALVSILRVFDLVGEAVGRVFSTEMARHSRRLNPGLLAAPWLLAGSIALAVMVLLPAAIHHFYGGRYDIALPLLPWLVAAAGLRFVEMVPRGFLAYLAPAGLLRRFAALQCIGAVGGVVLMVVWTAHYGVKGIVWGAALIAAARVGVSYSFLVYLRWKETDSPAGSEDVVVEPLEARGEQPPV